jgi:FkbM family methyltransferase
VEHALSDKAGVARLYVKDSYGECMSSSEYAPDGLESAIDVATITLDDFVASKALSSVRLMKIDVEGAEYAVLRGGRSRSESRSLAM